MGKTLPMFIGCPGCGINLVDVMHRWQRLAIVTMETAWLVHCDCGARIKVAIPFAAMLSGQQPEVRTEHLNPEPRKRFRRFPERVQH